jgi:chromosome partitioning protein
MTAEENEIDIVLVDMSPSVGALNQCFLMGSDYFVVPTSPDYYCNQAISSLARVIPRWNVGVSIFRNPALRYPFPAKPPQFCGIISQRYRPRNGNPASSFQQWINIIKTTVLRELVPALEPEGMVISIAQFNKSRPADTPYNLANISDFNSLIAQSQKFNTPVFALSDAQIEQKGTVLNNMAASRDNFRTTFASLAATIEAIAGV